MNSTHMSDSTPQASQPLYKVLVVEDSSVQRMHLRGLIYASPAHRCTVLEAGNGEEALQIMAGMTPDLVFTDVYMPRLNGIQLLQRMREDPGCQSVPVVMVTSLNDRRTMRQALVCGADAYLLKPYQDHAFLRVLHRQLGKLEGGGQAPEGGWTFDESWLQKRLLPGLSRTATPLQLSIAPHTLTLDEEDLLMCLAELAANACTHGTAGRPWSIQARVDLRHYVVSVRNEGPPVPAAVVNVPAGPIDRTATVGVGLALAATCAQRMGASIRWANTSGAPNIIQVLIPAQTPAA